VRHVEHLAVEADHAGAGGGGERIYDPARVRDLGGVRAIGGVNDGDLVGVDGDAAGEAELAAGFAVGLEAGRVAEVDVNRVERLDVRGDGAGEAEGAGELVGEGVGA
jgi:hypothetical protein